METPEVLGIEVHASSAVHGTVRLFDTSAPSAQVLSAHADVHRDGNFICHMVVARSFHHREELLAALEARAHAWIEDWEPRDHSGNTGFVQL